MEKYEYQLFLTNTSTIFKENTPSKFDVPLCFPLNLTEGLWNVALKDIAIQNSGGKNTKNSQPMLIYSNICENVLNGPTIDPLLAVTFINVNESSLVHVPIKEPFYAEVVKEIVSSIQFRLCTEHGKPFPLEENAKVYLTLHLKRM